MTGMPTPLLHPQILGKPSVASFPHTTFLLLVLINIPYALSCIPAERDSLRSFLSYLSSTSQANLSSWGAAEDSDCCFWDGVTCDNSGFVIALALPSRGLQGSISPSLGDLPRLTKLDLSHNYLSGTVESALLMSGNLVSVNLSYNSLSDLLPEQLPSLPKLQVLDISSNNFNGSLSLLWDAARGLTILNASNNSFSGVLPNDICSMTQGLQELDLSRNKLSGQMPAGLGHCSELRVLHAGYNNLSGEIPSDLYDAISLQQLSLPFNDLSGMLDGIVKLEKLVLLDMSGNEIDGQLPDSMGKLVKLEHLSLNGNRLIGPLPSSLSNCTRLKCLNLRENNFNGLLSAINFTSLADLVTLDLGNNNFSGGLPASIYSCTSLTALRLAKNNLQVQLDRDLVNLKALSYLSLSANKLQNITEAFQILKSCKNLTTIVLSTNFIGDSMPEDILGQEGGFLKLRILSLANCQLRGQVPYWLSKLQKLEVLDLSLNQLTGPIPGWLGNLAHLFYLDLSQNNFDRGEFPLDLMKLRVLASRSTEINRSSLPLPVFNSNENTSLPSLQYDRLYNFPVALYLRDSGLEGVIPPEIGQLKMLQVLDLSRNHLTGQLPVQMSNLTNLLMLVLSENHLSGCIPRELTRLSFLSSFNVSYNNLSGPIPEGGQFDSFSCSCFAGNSDLYGPLIDACRNVTKTAQVGKKKQLNRKIIVGVMLGVFFGGALVLILLVILVMGVLSRKRDEFPGSNTDGKEDNSVILSDSIPYIPQDGINSSVVLFPGNSDAKGLTISDVLKATNNFNQDSIVGCGGFGLVYKAVLPNGSKLAIKKLSGETGIMEREFKAEVEALSNAKHENLVTLQGYCIYGSFRLLIYSYMENGSLDHWLHEKVGGAAMLTWPIRLQIARGTSRGLSYIHQICDPHIVHRDIKSSNILLDHGFQAHVADFGLSRLILPTNTHVSTELVGTLGYIPPEYGQAWIATLRGDIYSFGVVMLELLTGRRPFEVFKPKQSRELVGWVQQVRSNGNQAEIFDPLLRHDGSIEQMLQVLDLACRCVNSNPFKRPTIREIVSRLDTVGGNQQTENV